MHVNLAGYRDGNRRRAVFIELANVSDDTITYALNLDATVRLIEQQVVLSGGLEGSFFVVCWHRSTISCDWASAISFNCHFPELFAIKLAHDFHSHHIRGPVSNP